MFDPSNKDHNEYFRSRWSRKMMSTDTVDCPEDRGGPPPGFGGAVKRISVLDNVGKAFGRRYDDFTHMSLVLRKPIFGVSDQV